MFEVTFLLMYQCMWLTSYLAECKSTCLKSPNYKIIQKSMGNKMEI